LEGRQLSDSSFFFLKRKRNALRATVNQTPEAACVALTSEQMARLDQHSFSFGPFSEREKLSHHGRPALGSQLDKIEIYGCSI